MKREIRLFSALLALVLMLVPAAAGLAEEAEGILPGYVPGSVNTTEYYIRDESASWKSYDDEFIDAEVIGPDDREVIDNLDEYPFCAVAYLNTHFPCACGDREATGFMVERNKMMTAAHCLVCSKHSVWADEITFYFGFRDYNDYTYKYDGKWYAFVGNTFTGKKYTTDADWAVVKFYENVGDIVGWFGYYYNMSNKKITGNNMLLLGYRDGILKISEGYANIGEDDLIKYKLDMEPGNSGGPVFFLEDGIPYAAAINIAEDKDIHWNFGFRITDTIYSRLMQLDDY